MFKKWNQDQLVVAHPFSEDILMCIMTIKVIIGDSYEPKLKRETKILHVNHLFKFNN